MALLLGLAGPVALPLETASLHPLLAQLASEAPDDLVSVIVQTRGESESVQLLAREHGATITHDLYIINAFAAEMPAAAASRLSEYPSVRWVSPDAEMEQASHDDASFITWANGVGSVAANDFAALDNILDAVDGPNDTYACGGKSDSLSVGGFAAEITPGYEIEKVELLLYAYVTTKPTKEALLHVFVDGVVAGADIKSSKKKLNKHIGSENAGEIVIDISNIQDWTWSDFSSGVELVFDHSLFTGSEEVCYDAIGLRVTSKSGNAAHPNVYPTSFNNILVDETKLENAFPFAVQAIDVWDDLQGQGLTVAVVDSGFRGRNKDLEHRVILNVNFNSGEHNSKDSYGHGTLVAGLIAGDGKKLQGAYVGFAPRTNIINVRVSDDVGMSTESDVIESLQWIYEHHLDYNIRVVNLSLNSTLAQSYHVSPLDAALEILWFNGVVVVVSGGNGGSGILYPPANDPFLISVGAADDMGTQSIEDDVLASFSAYGVTESGYSKPDIVAPGVDLIAYLPNNPKLVMGKQHPANSISKDEFRVSGTSFSAPLVSGAVALLLQNEPGLTPDQVKYRLMDSAAPVSFEGAGAGYLDIYAAVDGDTLESANTGIEASQLLWSGDEPINWNSVNWNSVNWNSVNWNSDHWDDSPTATETPEPTATDTPEPTATDTPEPTATNTPEPTATNTPEPTATNTPEPTATNTPTPPTTSVTVESRVSASSDDAEEKLSASSVNLTSSDIELIYDGEDQTVGLRFLNMTIPQGATITNAYIEFKTDETQTGVTNVNFYGQANDDPATFTSANDNISSRVKTTAFVQWNNVPAWNTIGQLNQTPNLSSPIQEIVDRAGWASGNAMVIIVTGSGTRTAESYYGDAASAALLHVEYTEVATAGVTVSPTSGLVTTEAGGTDIFTVVLDTQPTADVTIALSSSDTSEGTVSPASLTFTALNWGTAQTVTVTGVDDAVADSNIAFTIVTAPAVSTDTDYNGLNPADVSVTNNDDEVGTATWTFEDETTQSWTQQP